MHEELLVGVTLQLRFGLQSLSPCLLHDLAACSRLGFIQRVDGGEVNLLVDVVLERGREVVGVIVCGALGVIVAMMVVFIVTVGHCWRL